MCANSAEDAEKLCKDKAEGKDVNVCEPCNSGDGCNGVPQYGPVMMLIAIPVAILLKISSF